MKNRRALLVLNAGSSTLKYALYSETLQCRTRGMEEGADHATMLARIPLAGYELLAAGHRVVHGGDRYSKPTLLDDGVIHQLEKLEPLAPLHQPHNLAGVRAVMAVHPGLPQVACFDTAFHQTQPEIARRFALPRALHDAGVKRYGFHGLSYEYVAGKLPQVLPGRSKIIVAHLGNGASLCALKDGRSVASTMGFTALDGLMMGTRSGAIDPGVLLYLMDEKRMDARQLERLLYKESGLLGVSGLSHDMRTLLASGDARAREAIDLYVYRIVREVGSLAAALGGLDALVFTGGIGEHAAPVRAAVCQAARWLGSFEVAVIPTNEEEIIARHTLELRRSSSPPCRSTSPLALPSPA
ncbi:MAG TPA: acetate/propionate family kinase [Burkholderiales bacterium]